MTPEEQARYDAWLATHRPGKASARAAARAAKAQAAWLRGVLAEVDAKKADKEMSRLDAEDIDFATYREGVFA